MVDIPLKILKSLLALNVNPLASAGETHVLCLFSLSYYCGVSVN